MWAVEYYGNSTEGAIFFNRLRELPGKMLSETSEASHGVCAPRFCVSMGFASHAIALCCSAFSEACSRWKKAFHFPAAYAAGYKEIAAPLLPEKYKYK